jgi:hypothetical protein
MRRFLGSPRPSPAMAVAFVALLAALSGTANALQGKNTVDSGDIKNGVVKSEDIKNGGVASKDIKNGAVTSDDVKNGSLLSKDFKSGQLPAGAQGPQGPQGPGGPQGPPGEDAITVVSSLTGDFEATNDSVSITPDGVEFGPYADGGADVGSICFHGLNGDPLSAVENLVYYARYVSEGDTGGVAVPYLRIFLDDAGTDHDAIFSPNTQPPDPDVEEGPFHEWVATSGLWRYDDDAGSGGEYGLNGAPFSTLVTDHGDESITDICITTGNTAGTQLAALLRWWEINGEAFFFYG